MPNSGHNVDLKSSKKETLQFLVVTYLFYFLDLNQGMEDLAR